MGEKREFEFDGAASPAEAAETLSRIAEGIKSRALSLSMGGEEIVVFPDGDLSLEIEGSEKKGKAKIEIAIAWKHQRVDGDHGQAPKEPCSGISIWRARGKTSLL